jgi:oligoendopeptidase F
MCETIVMQAVLAETSDPEEELAILETILIGDSQVIVDIHARFLFEQELFEKRKSAELSTAEIRDMMTRAQHTCYGAGVNPAALHPYLWAWKPHFYSTGRSFYNFPYAFGLLFGLGLYAIYQQRGADFTDDYNTLLASTGEASAADLGDRFGINIRTRTFWDGSLDIIRRRIDRYCALAHNR